MILLSRLNGPAFAVNPDLLLKVEATPDTTVLLFVDGTKYIVTQTMEEVLDAIADARAHVLARAHQLLGTGEPEPDGTGDGDLETPGQVR